jgi:DNA-binding transcriptional LysR family regulator
MTEIPRIASRKPDVKETTSMRRLSDTDVRLLRIFCTVVECGGFQSAQVALNLAQSTLSSHIAALEARLGSRLCDRGRGGFRMTPAGEDTYAAAQELFRGLERFEATMERVHDRRAVRLRVGLIDSVTTFDALGLPAAVARFVAAHPEAQLALDTDTSAGLQHSLLKGGRDVVVGPALQPMPGLAYAELAAETHHLYCGRDHEWFARPDRALGRQDLSAADVSVRSYMHFDDTYRLGRIVARATVGSMEAQEILILSGRYVGFLPAHRGAIWQAQGRMRAIRPADWSFVSRFFAAYDPRREGAPLRRAFVESLTAEAAHVASGGRDPVRA